MSQEEGTTIVAKPVDDTAGNVTTERRDSFECAGRVFEPFTIEGKWKAPGCNAKPYRSQRTLRTHILNCMPCFTTGALPKMTLGKDTQRKEALPQDTSLEKKRKVVSVDEPAVVPQKKLCAQALSRSSAEAQSARQTPNAILPLSPTLLSSPQGQGQGQGQGQAQDPLIKEVMAVGWDGQPRSKPPFFPLILSQFFSHDVPGRRHRDHGQTNR